MVGGYRCLGITFFLSMSPRAQRSLSLLLILASNAQRARRPRLTRQKRGAHELKQRSAGAGRDDDSPAKRERLEEAARASGASLQGCLLAFAAVERFCNPRLHCLIPA
jgi:hypothetical protein